jgi:hypothetical protein
MIEAIILICSLGMTSQACTAKTAEDVIRIKVTPAACAMAAQSVVASEAGMRAQGRQMKVVCGKA